MAQVTRGDDFEDGFEDDFEEGELRDEFHAQSGPGESLDNLQVSEPLSNGDQGNSGTDSAIFGGTDGLDYRFEQNQGDIYGGDGSDSFNFNKGGDSSRVSNGGDANCAAHLHARREELSAKLEDMRAQRMEMKRQWKEVQKQLHEIEPHVVAHMENYVQAFSQSASDKRPPSSHDSPTSGAEDSTKPSPQLKPKAFSPEYIKKYDYSWHFTRVNDNTLSVTSEFLRKGNDTQSTLDDATPDKSDANESDWPLSSERMRELLEAHISNHLNTKIDGKEWQNLSTDINTNSGLMEHGCFVVYTWTGSFKRKQDDNDGYPMKYFSTPWNWLLVKLRPFCIVDWDEQVVRGLLCYTHGKKTIDQLSTFLYEDSISLQRVKPSHQGLPIGERKPGNIRVVDYTGTGPAYASRTITEISLNAPMSFMSGSVVMDDWFRFRDMLARRFADITAHLDPHVLPKPQPRELKELRLSAERRKTHHQNFDRQLKRRSPQDNTLVAPSGNAHHQSGQGQKKAQSLDDDAPTNKRSKLYSSNSDARDSPVPEAPSEPRAMALPDATYPSTGGNQRNGTPNAGPTRTSWSSSTMQGRVTQNATPGGMGFSTLAGRFEYQIEMEEQDDLRAQGRHDPGVKRRGQR